MTPDEAQPYGWSDEVMTSRQGQRAVPRPATGCAAQSDATQASSPKAQGRVRGSIHAAERRTGDVLHCSFCGKSPEEVQRLIAGPTAYICDECIDLCNDILREEGIAAHRKVRTRLWTPKELKHQLDDYIIGQTQAKKILSVAVYNRVVPQ